MYIKNNDKTYNCTSYNGINPVVSVYFHLDKYPELEGDEIQLFTSESDPNRKDVLLRTVHRSDYKREVITTVNDNLFTLLLTNSPEENPEDDVNNAKENKIRELSEETERRINEGIEFDIEGELKHFSFEAHDQQNISMICQYLSEHEEVEGYLYHADGEEFKVYSKEALFSLRDAMLQYIVECNEKYNRLRTEVNECTTVEEVADISFDKE